MTESYSLKIKLRPSHQVKVWVLQLGGWTPILLANVDVLLVDRSVLSAIHAISIGSSRPGMDADRWWLEQLNSDAFALNAVLCASESERQQVPSFEEFCAGVEQTTKALSEALPEARLVRHSPEHYAKLYENVIAGAERREREVVFLKSVSPLIASRVSSQATAQIEASIISLAREHDLSLHSFVVLAVLSCLYEAQDGTGSLIGRGIINPAPEYSDLHAHNAISDLRALEFLLHCSGLAGARPGFCTRDKNLAEFWVGLHASEPTWTGKTFSAVISPDPDLFPRLDQDGFRGLLARIRDA